MLPGSHAGMQPSPLFEEALEKAWPAGNCINVHAGARPHSPHSGASEATQTPTNRNRAAERVDYFSNQLLYS